ISNPDDLERELPMMDELLAGRRDRYSLTKRFTRRDGEPVRAFVDVELMRAVAGHPAKAIGVIVSPKLPEVDCAEVWRFEGVDELEAMRLLLAEKELAERAPRRARRALAELALAAMRAGTTARALGEQLGVSTSTVQGWAYRARRRG